jgi:apolipoprotein N-acyltransferase
MKEDRGESEMAVISREHQETSGGTVAIHMPGDVVSSRRIFKIKIFLLVLCFVCSIFTQYESVAPCLIGFHALFLSFIVLETKLWRAWLGGLFVSLGMTLSMSQIFRTDDQSAWDWTSFGMVLIIQLAEIHAFLFFAIVHVRLVRTLQKRFVYILCYPTLVSTGYAIAALYTPIASQASMAYAMSEWLSLCQIVSVFGLSSVNMVITVISTSLCHFFLVDVDDVKETKARRIFALRLGFAVPVVVWLYGSFRLASPRIYQKGISETAVPADSWIDGACIVRSGSAATSQMVNITRSTLNNSPSIRFIVWSEYAAGEFFDDTLSPMLYSWQRPLLSEMLDEVKALAITHKATIGVTFGTWVEPSDPIDNTVYNKLVFVNSDGVMAADYTKRYPVPIIESEVAAGADELAYVNNSTIGAFNAAICFDLDRPEFIRSGSSTGMLFQSANTWGIVGHFHAISSSFRGIENGMHLLRCGSNGPSGLYDPYGRPLMYQERKDTGVVFFQVPVHSERVWTFYSHVGFVFDYILLVAAAAFFSIYGLSFKRSLSHRL